jgi:hypothetical protein
MEHIKYVNSVISASKPARNDESALKQMSLSLFRLLKSQETRIQDPKQGIFQ